MLVKICGITRQEDLDAASEAGADICGFVFHKGSPRYIEPREAGRLDSGGMARAGVFTAGDYREIAAASETARLDFIQLHGDQSLECAARLKPRKIIKVFWPDRYESPETLAELLRAWAGSCALFLFDAGQSLGGSGVTIKSPLESMARPPRPWLLAGGLNSGNLREIIAARRPDGVDLNSGLETSPGVKDRAKIFAALGMARGRGK